MDYFIIISPTGTYQILICDYRLYMATNLNSESSENQDASQLMQNGLSFLRKAITELETDPKFSVVNFWNGVEILMKVPLVNHDWKLIVVSKKGADTISREEFASGNFRSVSFNETCRLLKSELGISIDTEARSFFERVQNHRNRMVHFYHGAVSEAELDALRNEQSDAWFALSRLITVEWRKSFRTDQWSDVNAISRTLLHSSKYYASAKYRSIKYELDQSAENYRQCRVCAQMSYLATKDELTPVFTEKCKVCNQFERYILARCPECLHESKLEEGDEPFKCNNCGHSQDRFSLLDEDDSLPQDYIHSSTPAGCCECESFESVCQYGEGFLCTQCLTYHESLEYCEHCSHSSSAVPEHSSMVGCLFCDGHPETWDLHND